MKQNNDVGPFTSLNIRRGKPFNLNGVLLAVWLVAITGLFPRHACPQDVASLDRTYHPGESIHVVITFASPVQLSTAGVQFSLSKLDNQAQRLWTASFNLTQLKPLQAAQYEATGTVPE